MLTLFNCPLIAKERVLVVKQKDLDVVYDVVANAKSPLHSLKASIVKWDWAGDDIFAIRFTTTDSRWRKIIIRLFWSDYDSVFTVEDQVKNGVIKRKLIPIMDPKITALTIETQFTGDNLYDIIHTLYDEHDKEVI